VYRLAGEMGRPAAEVADLRDFVRRTRPDSKREDAIALMNLLASTPTGGAEGGSFRFERTYYWEKLTVIVRSERARGLLAAALVATDGDAAYKAVLEDRRELISDALFDLLVQLEGDRLGLLDAPAAAAGDRAALERMRGELSQHYRLALSPHLAVRLADQMVDMR